MADEYAEAERPALDALETPGWEVTDQQRTDWHDPRETRSSAVLEPRLRAAVERLNPWINENNLDKAVREIQQVAGTSTMDENEQIHEKLVSHRTSVMQDRGHGTQNQTVKYIDFENPHENDFFALNQFDVEGPIETIRPDVVLFVNGLPLGVVECKAPTIAEPRSEALEQLHRYQNVRTRTGKEGAEELFRYNQFSVAVWYEGAVMGTYKTPKNQYKPWRDPYPLEDEDLVDLFDLDGYVPPQYRMLYVLFEPERLLDQLRHFTVFDTDQSGTKKLVARYQQYRAVRKAIERIDNVTSAKRPAASCGTPKAQGSRSRCSFSGSSSGGSDPTRSSSSLQIARRSIDRSMQRSTVVASRTRYGRRTSRTSARS
jgi:type I restriction enzyme R subunit